MTPEEAAVILGVTPAEVRAWQVKTWLPDPIPDDYLDKIVDFRLRLEKAHQRKMALRDGDIAPS